MERIPSVWLWNKIQNWQRQLNAATRYIQSDNIELNENLEIDDEEICEEWMYLAKLVAPQKNTVPDENDENYIDSLHANYSDQEAISVMPFWLEKQKAQDETTDQDNLVDNIDYENNLNQEQLFAYNIVKHHFETLHSFLQDKVDLVKAMSSMHYVVCWRVIVL